MSGVADTARLLATYEVQDNSAAGVTSALGGVGRLETATTSLGSRLSGFASNLRNNVGGALQHFSGRLGQLASAGAGLLGIGGLFSFGALFKSGLDEARDFGGEVLKLSKITGLSVETTSALASAMHHFGIEGDTALRIAGLYLKNINQITHTTKSAAAFQKQYGLAVTDSKGRALDFNRVILAAADFWNRKGIPQQQKVAALAKLFGKNWQELVPILSAGSRGIAEAESEAKRLGLTLTKDNIEALRKSKEATREWDTALSGLKLQIGVNILPLITDLAKGATGFLVGHRDEIISFFKHAVEFIRKVPAFFRDDILPVIEKIKAGWDKLPQGVKDFLIKGLVADRVIKFAFGFSPIGAAAGGLLDIGQVISQGVGSALGNVLSGTVQEGLTKVGLGRLFIQPVFVTNPGFGAGGMPGGIPGGKAGGGLLGKLGTGLAVATAAVSVAELVNTFFSVNKASSDQATEVKRTLDVSLQSSPPLEDLKGKLAAIDTGIDHLKHDFGGALQIAAGNSIQQLETMRGEVVMAIGQQTGVIHNADRWWSETATNSGRTSDRVEAMRAALSAKQDTANANPARIADKRESVKIDNFIRLSTTVSVSSVERETYIHNAYNARSTNPVAI